MAEYRHKIWQIDHTEDCIRIQATFLRLGYETSLKEAWSFWSCHSEQTEEYTWASLPEVLPNVGVPDELDSIIYNLIEEYEILKDFTFEMYSGEIL